MFASILHADADSFFASVEQRDDPALRGRPVIVGMGVVLAASYEAKAHGVHTPMGGRQALRLCPEAIVVPPRMTAYTEASKALYAVFEETTPLVEGLSIDEAFLDVRGMERSVGTPLEIAHRLRRSVRERVGIPVTVGVARTKFLAKVASAAAKPDGLLLVPPDGERASCTRCPSRRCGASARRPPRSFGAAGSRRSASSRAFPRARSRRCSGGGREATCTRSPTSAIRGASCMRPRRRSIGSQHARGRGRRPPEEVDADLVAIVDRVMRRVRAAHRVGRTVVLRLRFDDFSRATRSRTLFAPTARTAVVLAAARGLLAEAQPLIDRRGLTLIGISVAGLADDLPFQLELPFEADGAVLLDGALDEIRDRFGTAAVTRAVLLGRSPLSVPLLPD